MGRIADAAAIQYRVLGRGKGPAVRSSRAQADRMEYRKRMKEVLEGQERLHLVQAEIVEIRVDETGAVCAVVSDSGAIYKVRACVIATGTFLGGRTICGEVVRESGPDHCRSFEMEASVDGKVIGTGAGRTKKEAEQMAAKVALEKLNG